MMPKPSAEPTPRPPDTTIAASCSSGRPPFAAVDEPVIVALLAASLSTTETSRRSPAADAGSGAMEFGRTVMIGTPVRTLDRTTVDPPKTLWVAWRSAETSTASVMTPEPSRTASRPATSLPSAVLDTSTALG